MNIIDTIIRDVCATDRADPCSRDTVCIDVEDLRVIIANNLPPTQGADARPVAIYQIQAHIAKTWLDVTKDAYESTPFARRIVYATRDAAPSEAPETPWSKVMELAEHHGVWIDQYGWVFGNDDAVHAFAQAIAAIAPRGKT